MNRTLLPLAALLLAFGLVPPGAGAALVLQPTLTMSEEYNDNIYLEQTGERRDLITRVTPGFRSTYDSSLWEWNAVYAYDQRYFARRTTGDVSSHSLDLTSRVIAPQTGIILDVRDVYQRVSLSAVRDFTQESPFANQSDSNQFSVGPSLVLRPRSAATVTTGISYQNTWYKDPEGIDRTDLITFLRSGIELSPRFSVAMNAQFLVDRNREQNYKQTDVTLAERYEYSSGSYAALTVGNSWLTFAGGFRTSHPVWELDLTRNLRSWTVRLQSVSRVLPSPTEIGQRETSVTATVIRALDPVTAEAALGRAYYRDLVTGAYETNRTSAAGRAAVSFTSDTRIMPSVGYDIYVDSPTGAHTRLVTLGVRLEQRLSPMTTWSIEYHHADSGPPLSGGSSYRNNRLLAELRMQF